ncbi:MAG: DMT family transporter [Pseudomonadota bacterium]
MTILYLLFATSLGALLAFQPAINAAMAAKLGGPHIAAVCSIFISLIVAVAGWMVLARAEVRWEDFGTLPWWVVIGGIAGAMFAFGGIVAAPKLGVAVFFVCVIVGQTFAAAFADQIGAFGLEQRDINWTRGAGIALVVAGAALTQASTWLDS